MNQDSLIWIGRGLTGLFAIFIAAASVAPKLLGLETATETLETLGWDPRHTLLIGVLELTCLTLYLIPRTSVFGAVVFTALLGGAMATQLRAESPLFSHVLFSVYLGLVMWGGLWFRDPALRTLFPFRGGG